jgi:hypothetical protein
MNLSTIAKVTGGVAVLGVGFYFGRKAYKKHMLNKSVNAYTKNVYDTTGRKLKPGQKPSAGGGVQAINLVEVADSVARNLGVIYPSYDPRSWTENDTDVFNAIKALPPPLVPQLTKVYASKYKRNLAQDLERNLDDSYYQQIKNLLY